MLTDIFSLCLTLHLWFFNYHKRWHKRCHKPEQQQPLHNLKFGTLEALQPFPQHTQPKHTRGRHKGHPSWGRYYNDTHSAHNFRPFIPRRTRQQRGEPPRPNPVPFYGWYRSRAAQRPDSAEPPRPDRPTIPVRPAPRTGAAWPGPQIAARPGALPPRPAPRGLGAAARSTPLTHLWRTWLGRPAPPCALRAAAADAGAAEALGRAGPPRSLPPFLPAAVRGGAGGVASARCGAASGGCGQGRRLRLGGTARRGHGSRGVPGGRGAHRLQEPAGAASAAASKMPAAAGRYKRADGTRAGAQLRIRPLNSTGAAHLRVNGL